VLEIWQLIRGMDPAGLLFIATIGFVVERRQRQFGERLAHVEAQLEILVAGHRMVSDGNRTAPAVDSAR